MKRLFKGHIYLGRMLDRGDDEFINELPVFAPVRATTIRWFGGLHDLDSAYLCRAL